MKDSIRDYFELVLPILWILFIICSIITVGHMLKETYKYSEKVANEVNSNIGSKIVLDKDTLTVVDHSYWRSTYILSNSTEISSLLIDSLKINNRYEKDSK